MLMTIGIVLLVLWALGLLAFHVSSGVIHLLIVLAAIAIVVHLVRGKATDRLSRFLRFAPAVPSRLGSPGRRSGFERSEVPMTRRTQES